MIGLLQRASRAEVDIDGEIAGKIDSGLLIFLAIEKNDDENRADRLLDRLLGYRVFPDAEGKMNLNVVDVRGGLLVVPQFTLVADTKKGMRPSFSQAAESELGRRLFQYFLDQARKRHTPVAAGRFGADMRVTLTNDGPVTFLLEVR